ncbi:MAG: DUF1465 family protein [Alphaproteobacteria bacterium]|nr:DUF1465 family protein [Alphaproteobacteria bacterium]
MTETLTTTYFSALHDEAFSLLVEARNYIVTLRLQGTDTSKKNADCLDVTLETMRLTSRLTQVMAWILAQKAVQNEEITPEEAASKRYRLSGQSVCMENVPGEAAHVPVYLRDLLRRSYDLYCRVDRLEEQIVARLENGIQGREEDQENASHLRIVKTSGQSPQNAY